MITEHDYDYDYIKLWRCDYDYDYIKSVIDYNLQLIVIGPKPDVHERKNACHFVQASSRPLVHPITYSSSVSVAYIHVQCKYIIWEVFG